MKKSRLAFLAAAVALASILASCNNGSKEYIDVTYTDVAYAYKITGTEKTTITSAYKYSDTSSAVITSVYDVKVTSGLVSVTWTENSAKDSNYEYYYISGNVIKDESATEENKATTDGKTETTTDKYSSSSVSGSFSKSFYKIDDEYYEMQPELVKYDVDGDFGDDTVTISVTYTDAGKTTSDGTLQSQSTTVVLNYTLTRVDAE